MAKKRKNKSKIQAWLFNHTWARHGLDIAYRLFMSTLSALVFAVGFNCFMAPGVSGIENLASGGISGISQNVILFFSCLGWDMKDPQLAISIFYFALNVPLMVLAWFGIGKKFAIYTVINIAEVSLFMKLLTPQMLPIFKYLAEFARDNGGLITRVLFAGALIGLSSAICYKADFSAGGTDIIAYYFALRKGALVGKYSMIVNGITVTLFALLTCWHGHFDSVASSEAIGRWFFSFFYLLICKIVIDVINVRNKKVKVEVITDKQDLGQVLIDSLPHGATLVSGIGVYTGSPKYIVTMVVSSFEVKRVIEICQKEDEHAFVQAVALSAVYGRFHMKPVE